MMLAMLAGSVDGQCSDSCSASGCSSYSTSSSGTQAVYISNCAASSITLNSLYMSDSNNDKMYVELCPYSQYDWGTYACNAPVSSSFLGISSGSTRTTCAEYSGGINFQDTGLVLSVQCDNDWDDCNFIAHLDATCDAPTQVTSGPYLQSIDSECVGDGNAYTKALPCPATAVADCAYIIQVTASSSSWLEGSPNGNFVVVADGTNFQNWNNDLSFSTVAGPITDASYFNSGVFYVPPGSSYIFVAYNDNWVENMYLSGYIEFYPNTAPGSATNVANSGQSASPPSGDSLSSIELVALGFFVGMADKEPYSPPSKQCLTTMQQCNTDIGAVVTSLSSNNNAIMLSALSTMVNDCQSAMDACEPTSSCPGFGGQILDDVLDFAKDAVEDVTGLAIIVDAVKGVEVIADGYNAIQEGVHLVESWQASNWYEVGYDAGRIVHNLKEIYNTVKRRRRDAVQESANTTSMTNATQHHARTRVHPSTTVNLRATDGAVRTLQEWRALYNRTALAAFDSPQATTSTSSKSGVLGRGAVAAIVVGGLALMALIVVVAVAAVRRRRHQQLKQQSASGEVSSIPYTAYDAVTSA